MNKKQKIAIGISSSFLVVILLILSLISSAKPTGTPPPPLSSGGGCYEGADFWNFDPSTGKWTSTLSFSGGNRESAVAFTIGDKAYVGTGRQNGVPKKDFWERNGDTGVWTQLEDFGGVAGTARYGAIGFSIGDKGYIGTGIDANGATSDFWEYDPFKVVVGDESKWIKKSDFGGGVRSSAVGFSIDHKGYIGTGFDNTGRTADFWEYDGTQDVDSPTYNTWTQKENYKGGPTARAVGFSIGAKGYMGTGTDLNGNSKKDFYVYDPSSGKWDNRADFGGTPRSSAAGFATLGEGKGYIGTGIQNGTHTEDFYEYDPVTNIWTQKENYKGGPTAGAVAFSYRNYGFIGTGVHCEVPLPISCVPDTWTKRADFKGSPRKDAAGFSIVDANGIGKGYIGTGQSSSTTLKDFYEFDPKIDTPAFGVGSGSWTKKDDFNGEARSFATGFSIGNKGYIGTGSNLTLFKDFSEYNPLTGKWTKKAEFGGGIRNGTFGFAIGTKGYMGTGSANPTFQKDLWEFNPSAGSLGAWTKKAEFGGGVRAGAVSFAIRDKAYVGTGRGADLTKDFWVFDPKVDTPAFGPGSGSWTQLADFKGGVRMDAVGFSIGDKGYIGTGQGYGLAGQAYSDFYEYDPATNLWTDKASLQTGRFGAVGFSIGDKGYIGTGHSKAIGSFLNDFWEYCPG